MERVLSVSQINEYVRKSLSTDPMLRGVQLRGEISNFKPHSSGHLYFSLKDEASRIACVMFRSAAAGLAMSPREGVRVVATGGVSLYTATGQYQFYVDAMRDDGVGSHYVAFEKLKAKLLQEGLFDPSLKKPLPLLPRGVGIVTSATGAVVHDIQRVAARRHPGIGLYLAPAAVQGENAPEELIRGLRALEKCEDVDVMIIGRGGGSLEELSAFNDEGVARAIFMCKKPIISAVGHETDFTICDFVADVRAATPSNAAELAVPELASLLSSLQSRANRLHAAQRVRLSLLTERLEQAHLRLQSQKPSSKLRAARQQADSLIALATARYASALMKKRLALKAQKNKLEALSPARVLDRGYALVTKAGRLVTNASHIDAGDIIKVTLRSGALQAAVTEVLDGGQEETAKL